MGRFNRDLTKRERFRKTNREKIKRERERETIRK